MTDSTVPTSPPNPLPIPPPIPTEQPQKAGWLLMLGIILAVPLNGTVATINGILTISNSSERLGYILSTTLMMPLVIVAISAIWPKMRNNRAHLLVFFIASLVCILSAASSIGRTTTQLVQKKQAELAMAKDMFTVNLPNTPPWQKVTDGPITEKTERAYVLMMIEPKRNIRLSVMAMPLSSSITSTEAFIADWEKGFIQHASSKKSSANIQLNGHAAYKLVVGIDSPDGQSFEGTTILIIANGWSFNLGIVAPSGTDTEIPDITQFIDSFRIVDPVSRGRP